MWALSAPIHPCMVNGIKNTYICRELACTPAQKHNKSLTHTQKHTLNSPKYTRALSIWIILSYSKSYSCGLFYCIAARCPQTQYQLCLFPSPHLFLPALFHSFLFLRLSIAFPTPSRPMIYYFFFSDFNSPSFCYDCMLCGGAYFYFLLLGRLKRHTNRKAAKDNTQ